MKHFCKLSEQQWLPDLKNKNKQQSCDYMMCFNNGTNFQFSDWLCHGGVGSLQIHTLNRFYTSWAFIPCCEWSYHGFLKLSLPRHHQHCYHNLTLRPFYLSLTLSHFLILKFKHSVMTWTQVIDGWEGGASGFLKRELWNGYTPCMLFLSKNIPVLSELLTIYDLSLAVSLTYLFK